MGNSESPQLKDNRHSLANTQQLTYNGHRVSRRWEEDYVEISSDMNTLSKEQMEDQFTKIVVIYIILR